MVGREGYKGCSGFGVWCLGFGVWGLALGGELENCCLSNQVSVAGFEKGSDSLGNSARRFRKRSDSLGNSARRFRKRSHSMGIHPGDLGMVLIR